MVKDLSVIREKIDKVDKQIVKLLEERMDLAMEVADYKRATGKAIYDRERELQKLSDLGALANTEFNAKMVQEIFLQIMSASRRYQYSIIGNENDVADEMFSKVDKLTVSEASKVVYAGVPGAFAEEALVSFFGENVNTNHVKGFYDVAKMVSEHEADYGVLPIENSSAGFVNGIYDLLEQFELSVVGEQLVSINQCLLGIPGTDMDKVKTVFSHPQGLLQSKEYLREKDWQQVSMANTALSAKKVHDDGDRTQVAIASERAAKLYGLSVLKYRLNASRHNTTRFVIVSNKKEYVKNANTVSISFSLPHACGTLYNVLAHFIFNNVSMTSIESVPISGKQWEYCFFVDFEGNLSDNEVKNALNGIMAETENFRILGCFLSEK